MTIQKVAATVGKGMLAGMAGTTAITLTMAAERRLRDQHGPDTAPADAIGRALGIHVGGARDRKRLAALVHWLYGTEWGVPLALLALTGLTVPAAAAVEFGSIWGLELAMLPSLGVAPPLRRSGAAGLATSAVHHLVYTATAAATYAYLDRALAPRRRRLRGIRRGARRGRTGLARLFA